MDNIFELVFRVYRLNEDDNTVTIVLKDYLGKNAFIRCTAPLAVLNQLAGANDDDLDAERLGQFGLTYQKGVGVRVHLLAVK